MIEAIHDIYAAIELIVAAGGFWAVLVAQIVVTRMAITCAQAVLLALRYAGDRATMKVSRIRTAPDDLFLKRITVLVKLRYEASTRAWKWPAAGFGPESLARRPERLFHPRRHRPERSPTGWLVAVAYPAMWTTINVTTEFIRSLVGANAPNVVALMLVVGFGKGRELLGASAQWLTGAAGPTPQGWIGFALAALAVLGIVLSMTKLADIRGVGEYGKQATAQAYTMLARLRPVADDLAREARELAEDLLDPDVEPEIVERHRKALAAAWQRGREAVEETSSAYDQRFQLLRTAPPRARFLLTHLLDPTDSLAEDITGMHRPEAYERTDIEFVEPGRALLVHSPHEPVRAPARERHRHWIRALIQLDVEAREYWVAVERRLNPGPIRRLLHLTGK